MTLNKQFMIQDGSHWPEEGRAPESGNAFFMILIAVVLFAALAFTFSQGIRQGGENISTRQAQLAANDIISHAQKIERGVQQILSRGVSESDLSFANNAVDDYDSTTCSDDPSDDGYLECERGKVFGPYGAKLSWQSPPADINDGEDYFIGVNQAGIITETNSSRDRDLVLLLPVNSRICEEINKQTTGIDAWPSTGILNSTVKFTGDYTAPTDARINWPDTEPEARPSGCFCTGSTTCTASSTHYFYHVLHERQD